MCPSGYHDVSLDAVRGPLSTISGSLSETVIALRQQRCLATHFLETRPRKRGRRAHRAPAASLWFPFCTYCHFMLPVQPSGTESKSSFPQAFSRVHCHLCFRSLPLYG